MYAFLVSIAQSGLVSIIIIISVDWENVKPLKEEVEDVSEIKVNEKYEEAKENGRIGNYQSDGDSNRKCNTERKPKFTIDNEIDENP